MQACSDRRIRLQKVKEFEKRLKLSEEIDCA
jgi:hypothetical protein